MKWRARSTLISGLLLVAAFAAAPGLQAAEFPSRPIKLVVPYAFHKKAEASVIRRIARGLGKSRTLLQGIVGLAIGKKTKQDTTKRGSGEPDVVMGVNFNIIGVATYDQVEGVVEGTVEIEADHFSFLSPGEREDSQQQGLSGRLHLQILNIA